MPVPLPTAYDDRRNLFTMRGCFCSWSCVKGYVNEMRGIHQAEQCSLVAFLIKRAYGSFMCSREHPPAPGRLQLTKFGGSMSIEEFRKNSKPADLKRRMLPNLFNKDVPIGDYIILHDNLPARDNKIQQTAEAEEEPLRIKRKGPERKHSNTLSRLMRTGATT